jgi:hypothetical protein
MQLTGRKHRRNREASRSEKGRKELCFISHRYVVVYYINKHINTREEHRLRVFKNKVLRRMCAPKRNEVTVGSRRLHNEELHNPYASAHIIRIIKPRRTRGVGYVARMGREKLYNKR